MEEVKWCKKCMTDYPLTKDFWYIYSTRAPACRTCRKHYYERARRKILNANKERYYRRKLGMAGRVPHLLRDIIPDLDTYHDERLDIALRLIAKEFMEAKAQGEQAIEGWISKLLYQKDRPVKERDLD